MRSTTPMRERPGFLNYANPDLLFVVMGAALTFGAIVLMDPNPAELGYKENRGFEVLFAILQNVPVAFSRRFPFAAILVLSGAVILEIAFGYAVPDPSAVSAMVVTFMAAVRAGLPGLVVGIPLTFAIVSAVFFADPRGREIGNYIGNMIIFGAVWIGGIFVRTRVIRVSQVERRAAELSMQRDVAAQEGAEQERVRIARELHDVVGHTLNLIVVQAGAAQRVRNTNPDAAFDALRSIESTGRQALGDMDRMLGILRSQPESADTSALGPRPGLGRLNALVDKARAAGLEIESQVFGEQRALPASIDLTAYRVIQEAVTNVIKHAPGSSAAVLVEYGPASLNIEVRNGPARGRVSQISGGRGLAGMRERVALFNGTIKTGSTDDGGYVVSVVLPIDGKR